MFLHMYEQSLPKLVGDVMATGPHSQLDVGVERCSTCEGKLQEVKGHERRNNQTVIAECNGPLINSEDNF